MSGGLPGRPLFVPSPTSCQSEFAYCVLQPDVLWSLAGRASQEVAMDAAPDNDEQPAKRRTFVNFGGNVTWEARCYRPRDEQDVLAILSRHRSERIRAIGSLHAWS